MVWYGMVWYGMVWYGMVWYGMVWYGMVYGMVWYGMQIAKLAHRKCVSSWIYFHSRAEDVFLRLQLVYRIVYNINCPRQLQGYLVRRSDMHSRSLRDNILLHVIKTKTKMGQSSFKCAASKDWNELPQELLRVQSLSNFKTKVQKRTYM
jgi:hypothetical protein